MSQPQPTIPPTSRIHSVSIKDGSQTGAHPSAIGAGTQPGTAPQTQQSNDGFANADATNTATNNNNAPEEGYPEQKHAGAVGYGPNYSQRATFGDKLAGVKEEIKGKVTKNPDLAHQGHDRMTGELKRREREDDQHTDAFANPDEKKADEGAQGRQSTGTYGQSHEFERAATVSGEGTERAEYEKSGDKSHDMKHIG